MHCLREQAQEVSRLSSLIRLCILTNCRKWTTADAAAIKLSDDKSSTALPMSAQPPYDNIKRAEEHMPHSLCKKLANLRRITEADEGQTLVSKKMQSLHNHSIRYTTSRYFISLAYETIRPQTLSSRSHICYRLVFLHLNFHDTSSRYPLALVKMTSYIFKRKEHWRSRIQYCEMSS